MWEFLLLSSFCTVFLSIGGMTTTITSASLPPSPNSKAQAGYNESCNEVLHCKDESWLECNEIEGICQCSKSGMVYDPKREKCVALIGKQCMYEVWMEDRHGRYETQEIADCIMYASCEEGYCKCYSGLQQGNLEGTQCLQGLSHGSPCKGHIDCDRFQKLACLEGTCQCFAPTDMEYNSVTANKGCRIKVGHNCKDLHNQQFGNLSVTPTVFPGELSPANLNRSRDEWENILYSFSYSKCSNGFECYEGICSCSTKEFMNTTTRECQPTKGRGKSCSNPKECDISQLLSCLEGICECDSDIAVLNDNTFRVVVPVVGGGPYKDVARNICVAKVGASCSVRAVLSSNYYVLAHDNIYCHEEAECISEVCVCKGSRISTLDKMCGRDYGEECSLGRPCSDYLVCTSSDDSTIMKCRCPNEITQIYEPHADANDGCAGLCRDVRLIGTQCDPVGPTSCVRNAECVSEVRKEERNYSTLAPFYCKCKSGFVENFNGHCDIAYGFKCNNQNSVDRCDRMAGLKCRIVRKMGNNNVTKLDQVCSCANLDDVYDQYNRKCTRRPVALSCNEQMTDWICPNGGNFHLHPQQRGPCTPGAANPSTSTPHSIETTTTDDPYCAEDSDEC